MKILLFHVKVLKKWKCECGWFSISLGLWRHKEHVPLANMLRGIKKDNKKSVKRKKRMMRTRVSLNEVKDKNCLGWLGFSVPIAQRRIMTQAWNTKKKDGKDRWKKKRKIKKRKRKQRQRHCSVRLLWIERLLQDNSINWKFAIICLPNYSDNDWTRCFLARKSIRMISQRVSIFQNTFTRGGVWKVWGCGERWWWFTKWP